MTVEISILGPVEATRDGRRVELGPPQQRALLALLALEAPRVKPVETIVDALWPDDPPPSAPKIVQTYVSRLRKALGEDAIERRGSAYALRVPPEAVDLRRFERLVRDGAPAAALALWRGPPLADVTSVPELATEAERLEELRLRALEEQADAEIAAGRHGAVVGDLRRLAAAHPLRERLLAQLMLALYLDGRQAEALEVYRDARRKFADELGLDPAPALKELERRILAHDPELRRDGSTAAVKRVRPPAAKSDRRSRPSLRVLAGATALVAVTATAAAVSSRRDDDPPRPRSVVAAPHSIVRIDPRANRVAEAIRVGRNPGAIAVTREYVWVVNDADRTLSRVDPRTKDVETIGGLPFVGMVAADERGNVYVSGFDDPLVSQIDPLELKITRRYRVRTRAVGLAVGGGSLWVVDRLANAVRRIDLATATIDGTIRVGRDPLVATFGYGALWVANSDDASLSVVRPGVSKVETVAVSSRPLGVAAGEGGVWVGSYHRSTITRVDPETRRVIDAIETGLTHDLGLFSVTTGGGAVWATNPVTLEVLRIDPRTNRLATRIKLRGSPRGIAAANDQIWVAVSEVGAE